MAERVGYQEEEKSVWKSRLFKLGVVVAVVSAAIGVSEAAAAGVLIAGVAWAAWKGK